MLKLTLINVKTPTDISQSLGCDELSLRQLKSSLFDEFRNHKRWTEQCTSLLTNNLTSLFLYDRLEYALARAYGHSLFKILLNPLMIFCYHHDCINSSHAPIHLKHVYDLSNYLHHLKDHNDTMGIAMQKRFTAVSKNLFIAEESLDALSRSPYILEPIVMLSVKSQGHIQSYGINRHLASRGETYVCHWKNRLLTSKIIGPSSLTFQEDEALVYSLLHYPNPVRDWSVWDTLSFYCMKMYSSISAAGLNLYRGVTYNRVTGNQYNRVTGNQSDSIQSFFKSINHPGPSLTTEQRNSPMLNYDNQVYHKSQLLFHLKLLEKNEESVSIVFPKVKRYPVTLGTDEQEINQGTFVYNGKLLGLEKQMSVEDLKNVGINNLGKFIAEKNNYVTCIREYRLTDFAGFMCSNIYSSFEAGSFTYERCEQQLKYVVELSRTCLLCLKNNRKCVYLKIDVQCSECLQNGSNCVSIIVFHTLWDMAPTHVKTTTLASQIDSDSSDSDYFLAALFTMGFGGLHVVRAVVNSERNHILSCDGMNYGMNIFRAVKQVSGLLDTVKQAVFVGKDRQSDYLSFMSSCHVVQEALEKSKTYKVVRVPEPVLSYTENAKSQKEIVLPTALTTNKNGDVFVLDVGASGIHVIDRCVVSRTVFIGKYKSPSMEKYPTSGQVVATKAKFSNQLTDMIAVDDDLYISDGKRKEIVIVRNVITAKTVNTCRIQVLFVGHCLSLAHTGIYLVILLKLDSGQKVQFVSVNFPGSKSKNKNEINAATFKVVVSVVTYDLGCLFTLNDSVFGALDETNHVCFFMFSGKKVSLPKRTDIISDVKPCSNKHGQLITLNSGDIITHDTCIKADEFCVERVADKREVINVHCFHQWGEVLYVSKLLNVNRYVLEEHGPLTFGLNLCRAVNMFYDAISYVAPGGGNSNTPLCLKECIEKATRFVNLVMKMQKSREDKYTARRSFSGEYGTPFSKTIECIIHNLDSWKALQKRLDFFSPGLANSVYSHSVTSESWVKHYFGFTTKKGQGHLQSMEEYIQSKRKHAIDFQMRMCDAPFCQSVKVKVRDKGYQNYIDNRKVKLSVKEVNEIFQESQQGNHEHREVSKEGEVLLRKAYLFSKSVPRQSNRAKWRERSGYQPNLLVEASINVGKLVAGDIVFAKGIQGEILNLVVKQDILLDDGAHFIQVYEVGKEDIMHVKQEMLLLDKGLIATVPSNMYTIDGSLIIFNDLVHDMLECITCVNESCNSDSDWADILQCSNIEKCPNKVIVKRNERQQKNVQYL